MEESHVAEDRRARRLTKWYRLLMEKLTSFSYIDEGQRDAVSVHLNDLWLASGRLRRLIERVLRVDPEDAEEMLDVLTELQVEAEHARHHINELLPVLEAVIDVLPVEDDEEE